ncbi:phosphonoacetaldehyde hydrolase [Bacteroides cutis]|uniref:phosphonoacetaldehyde hydrolase n=1 Tax=Bacteroides cutis TaxID=2024197 RepID=UPI0023A85C0F|nr:phosphonoacetaldehyde hydrolase [Bacteroides cutis]
MKKIECVIMDWAGTAVDYGCFAPVAAFVESFKQMGVNVTPAETRAHMGLTKIEEIRALFAIERVAEEFHRKYGRTSDENDVRECYKRFQDVLFATLEGYSNPIPGVVEVIAGLRTKGIKIGSTTGYTKSMMDVVIPIAEKKGYKTDTCVTSDHLPGGRPKPYMIYQNMCLLDVPSRFSVLKYGDTIADIREGVNAGVWSVGVVMGSNELGLSEEETRNLSMGELKCRMAKVRDRMYAAGADYVVDTIAELPMLIEDINERMAL